MRWEEVLGLPIHRLDGTPSARVFAYPDELDRWLQEKLQHVEEEAKNEAASVGRRKKRLLLCAAVLASSALAVTLIWRQFSPAPGPLPTRNASLAVLPFENSTGDISFGAWRTALPDLVITDLVQSRFVNVVRITDLLRKLVELRLAGVDRFSEADLRTVAEKLDVDYIATGTMTQTGPDKTLTVLVRTPKTPGTGQSIRMTFRAEEDVFAAVDALTTKIKQVLGLPGRLVSRDIDRPVNGISTSSPQAFKLYSQGYRLAGLAKYTESVALLHRAVELDPEFALGYKCLYRACQNANREDDEKTYVRKAIDLSGRLSDRERGELEVLFYRYYEIDRAKELKALERLNRTYPEDRFGSVNLLGYYLNREEWDKALPVAERAWPANKSDVNLCSQLALCYLNLGQGDRAESVLSDFIGLNAGHTYWHNAVRLRSHASTRLGKFDGALGDADRLIAYFPNDRRFSLDRGIVLLYKRDFAAAEGEFRRVLADKEPYLKIQALMLLRDFFLMRGRVEEAARQIRAAFDITDGLAKDDRRAVLTGAGLHLDLAYLHRLAGRPGQALEEVEAARQLYGSSPRRPSPPLDLLRLKALLLLDLDRREDFERQAEEVRDLIEQGQAPRRMRIYYHLLGYNEFKKGDYREAVAHFSRAVDLAPPAGDNQLEGANPEYWYSLAQAHARLDRGFQSVRAFSLYEKIAQPSVNRLHSGDIYARSLYEMARYYDAVAQANDESAEGIRLNQAKAAEKYREFLDLWGGADPIFAAEVEDARTRLAALEIR